MNEPQEYPHSLSNLNLRYFPADLHEQLREEAEQRRYTLREYVIRLLRGELRRPKNMEVK